MIDKSKWPKAGETWEARNGLIFTLELNSLGILTSTEHQYVLHERRTWTPSGTFYFDGSRSVFDLVRKVAPEQCSSATPLNDLARDCHASNQHWWHDPATGEKLVRNKAEMLFLMVSELCEAGEGERKDLMDDHLPHRKAAEVELADCLIRLFDYAGAYGFDLDGAVREKREYNANRADHKAEARLAAGGKKW